jgi:hypothetical protein
MRIQERAVTIGGAGIAGALGTEGAASGGDAGAGADEVA